MNNWSLTPVSVRSFLLSDLLLKSVLMSSKNSWKRSTRSQKRLNLPSVVPSTVSKDLSTPPRLKYNLKRKKNYNPIVSFLKPVGSYDFIQTLFLVEREVGLDFVEDDEDEGVTAAGGESNAAIAFNISFEEAAQLVRLDDPRRSLMMAAAAGRSELKRLRMILPADSCWANSMARDATASAMPVDTASRIGDS